jgi:hypothetical protein
MSVVNGGFMVLADEAGQETHMSAQDFYEARVM